MQRVFGIPIRKFNDKVERHLSIKRSCGIEINPENIVQRRLQDQ